LIQQQVQNKGCVKGIRLPGYDRLLKREYTQIGKDLAVFAEIASGIGDIIHSDEMPGYSLSEQEITEVKKRLQLSSEDAFVLTVGNEAMIDAALYAVLRRAAMFFDGVPEEVRRSLPDNTTEYMRPLPGAARMYPETDVPPIRITVERLQQLKLPEKPDEKRKRLAVDYVLNEEQIKQLLFHGYEDEFECLVKQFPEQKNVILRTYVNTLPELERNGVQVMAHLHTLLIDVFLALSKEKFAKEAVPVLVEYLLLHPTSTLQDATIECRVQSSGEEMIRQITRRIVAERTEFIKEKGINALGPLMGLVMKELRGKADGKLISKVLHEEITKALPK
jgi:glutamyl-tRNA(Gln) amidotransferase subunit E